MTRKEQWHGDYGHRLHMEGYSQRYHWTASDSKEARTERNRLLHSWAKRSQFRTGKPPESRCADESGHPYRVPSENLKSTEATASEAVSRIGSFIRGINQLVTGESNESDYPGRPSGGETA